MDSSLNFLTEPDENYKELLFMGLTMFILPLLDGISRREAEVFIENLTNSWNLNKAVKSRLTKEMEDVIA